MIIKGAPAGSVGFWTTHLERTDTNDAVNIRDVRGTLAQDLAGALREMQAVASGSRCRGNFMYQANINPLAHEELTPEQWVKAVDTLEKNLGLEDHQRVVIEHVKGGRQHYHIIWNRVDVDTMRVRDMGGNYYSHERTARQLEQEFGLERAPRVHGEREGERTSQRTDLWEYNRGLESGEAPKAIKAELTELWRASDSGPAFVEAIEERGYILTKGDRRDFCIIDRAGDEHSLARRLDGVTVKELKARLSGIDRASLPTVNEGKAQHAARQTGRDAEAAVIDERERLASMAKLAKADRNDNAKLKANAPLRDAQDRAFWTDYRARQDEQTEERKDAWRDKAEDQRSRAEAGGVTGKVKGVGIKVVDIVADVTVKLADFLADLFSSFVAPPEPQRTAFERLGDDPAERVAAIKAARRADAALENIADDLKRGDTVSAADIRSLSRGHLQEIAQNGDAGLLALIKRMEEDRERERDPGRGRER